MNRPGECNNFLVDTRYCILRSNNTSQLGLTCAVAFIRVTALMSTSAPTRNFVRGPVITAANRVDTVVIDTDSATSPFAIRVTRFEAVPPTAVDNRGVGIEECCLHLGVLELQRTVPPMNAPHTRRNETILQVSLTWDCFLKITFSVEYAKGSGLTSLR